VCADVADGEADGVSAAGALVAASGAPCFGSAWGGGGGGGRPRSSLGVARGGGALVVPSAPAGADDGAMRAGSEYVGGIVIGAGRAIVAAGGALAAEGAVPRCIVVAR
jgi:hypothetical protein